MACRSLALMLGSVIFAKSLMHMKQKALQRQHSHETSLPAERHLKACSRCMSWSHTLR